MKNGNKLSFRDQIARANSRGDFAAIFMMLPAVILLVVMSIYPFFWLFRYICYDYNGFNAYFTGTRNFIRMLEDETFWRSVLHTFEYVGLKLLFVIPLSLFLAVLLNQKLTGSSIYRGIYFIPTVISSAIYSLPKYISNFPYFTGFPACALAKRYVFSLIFALMR